MDALIIGSGRMAQHLHFYFEQLGIHTQNWSRQLDPQATLLNSLASKAKTIWLAVTDSAIENVIDQLNSSLEPKLIHLSGSHISLKARDCHFLGSFGPKLYAKETYQNLQIVSSSRDTEKFLKMNLPSLPNKINFISKEEKPKYHALCVLAGPGSFLLWSLFSDGLNEIGLPTSLFSSYLKTLELNWQTSGPGGISGPWIRNDLHTIESNLNALKKSAVKNLYLSLKEVYESQHTR